MTSDFCAIAVAQYVSRSPSRSLYPIPIAIPCRRDKERVIVLATMRLFDGEAASGAGNACDRARSVCSIAAHDVVAQRLEIAAAVRKKAEALIVCDNRIRDRHGGRFRSED